MVEALIPATRIVVGAAAPLEEYKDEIEDQPVFLPYEVSGPNSTIAWPGHTLVIVNCATNGLAVL